MQCFIPFKQKIKQQNTNQKHRFHFISNQNENAISQITITKKNKTLEKNKHGDYQS